MWYGTLENKGLDYIASIDTIAYDNFLAAESMAFDLDVGRDLWLNRVRWTNLLRMYLDLGETTAFIQRAAEIGLGEGKRGVITSAFGQRDPLERELESEGSFERDVAGMYAKKTSKHRWGNCMMSYGYYGLRNQRPTFIMHSRVSYIAYIGQLDLAVAYVLAREIGARIKVPIEEFRFRWHCDALQFHGFKSLPYLYKEKFVTDLEDPDKRAEFPTINLVGKWWDKILRDEAQGKTLEEEKYGPLRRVRKRYREYAAGTPLPPVPVESLTLSPLR